MPICVPSSSISLTCGARMASLIRARSAGRTGISTLRRGLKGDSPSSCFLLPRNGSAATASGRDPHPLHLNKAVQTLEGSKVCEQFLQAESGLLAPAIPHRERLLRLALAVDDHLRDLLELGVSNPLRHGLAALVEVHAISSRLDAIADRPRGFLMRRPNRNHAHLDGSEPERKRTAVVLDQDSDEALERAVERAMDGEDRM